MTSPVPVTILGLGLMGGSLARDLSARGVRVAAYDPSSDILRDAVQSGVVQIALTEDASPLSGIVILATPVDVTLDLLPALSSRLDPTALVSDLGSTKSMICKAAIQSGLGERFVGSHPLAGDHRSGWSASRAGLYENAPVFLCPTGITSKHACREMASFWESVGGVPVEMDADDHDNRMAWISHLPQLVASTLATTLAGGGYGPSDLGPGGRDMTRLASSSAQIWTAIARSNATSLSQALTEFQSRIASFVEALRDDDPEAIQELFRQASDWAS